MRQVQETAHGATMNTVCDGGHWMDRNYFSELPCNSNQPAVQLLRTLHSPGV